MISASTPSTQVFDLNATMPILWGIMGWGLFALFVVLFILQRVKAAKSETAAQTLKVSLAEQAARLDEFDALRDELELRREENADLEKQQVALKVELEGRERALAESKQRLETDFQVIASRLLDDANKKYIERADERFQKHEQAAKATYDSRQKEVDGLIKPMKETLLRYEEGLREMRDQQKKAQGQLTGQIEALAKSTIDVQAEAAKLTTALKTGSKTRGRWGEEQLRNVVEMTGLSPYCDFSEQFSVSDGESRKLPDMVVRLPGDRVIAVDSKVSLSAYLDASEQIDDAARGLYLKKHAEEIWTHVRSLSSKNYAEALRKSNSLDFVVMFIPGENFFAAAMEEKPSLFQDAFEKGVLMATPITLIAILKSIAYGWRQEKASENAHKVANLAQDLYKSMRTMGTNLAGLGRSIEKSVKDYNKTIGTIEGSVMPKARKFSDLEMPGTEEALPLLEPAEADIREVREGRDLIIEVEKKELL